MKLGILNARRRASLWKRRAKARIAELERQLRKRPDAAPPKVPKGMKPIEVLQGGLFAATPEKNPDRVEECVRCGAASRQALLTILCSDCVAPPPTDAAPVAKAKEGKGHWHWFDEAQEQCSICQEDYAHPATTTELPEPLVVSSSEDAPEGPGEQQWKAAVAAARSKNRLDIQQAEDALSKQTPEDLHSGEDIEAGLHSEDAPKCRCVRHQVGDDTSECPIHSREPRTLKSELLPTHPEDAPGSPVPPGGPWEKLREAADRVVHEEYDTDCRYVGPSLSALQELRDALDRLKEESDG